MDYGGNDEVVSMVRHLTAAVKIAGLTYQLATTVVLIGCLVVGVVQHVQHLRRKGG